MEGFRIDLAVAVGALATAGRVAVSETRTELALYQLDATPAREVVALLTAAGFRLVRLGDEGGDVPANAIEDAYANLELVAAKPGVPAGVLAVLTRTALLRVQGGIAIETPPNERLNGVFVAYLRDPDGNKLTARTKATR